MTLLMRHLKIAEAALGTAAREMLRRYKEGPSLTQDEMDAARRVQRDADLALSARPSLRWRMVEGPGYTSYYVGEAV